MLNQDSSKNTNENENLTSDLSFDASSTVIPPPSLPSPTNHDVEIANSTSLAPDASGVLTTPMEAAQSNNVIPPACIQHEATTLQLGTMSQFSSS
ncbi:hypothetical protein A2U01_0032677, partial [Trifolium medium]|nr:hypothetical protein [Trifolium medium]